MSAQVKNNAADPVAGRLRRYQVSAGLPWKRVAERLGVSLSMIMMVLRGDRNLSAKAMFRLEEAEREVEDRRTKARRLAEGLIGSAGVVDEVLGRGKKGQGIVNVAVDYSERSAKSKPPVAISLARPTAESCRKLRVLFAETLDTRLIALACLPEDLRAEGYLDRLTFESRARLTNAALDLVIPDWRGLVVKGLPASAAAR